MFTILSRALGQCAAEKREPNATVVVGVQVYCFDYSAAPMTMVVIAQKHCL